MKKITVLFLILFTVARLYSQGYEIDFTGTGAASAVDSVMVENLNQDITLTLGGNDVLILSNTTDINDDVSDIKPLQIYPNPMTEHAEIQFPVNESGNVDVVVFNMSGRPVIQSNVFLHRGMYTYRVTGLNQGIYIIRIQEKSSVNTGKLICRKWSGGEAEITNFSSVNLSLNQIQTEIKQLKSAASAIRMPYDDGDRLKFTGISVNYCMVLTDVPSCNKTITFDFMECTDADGNHYSVINLGTQTWMALNLETTKYNDGTAIPLVTDSTAWSLLTTPAYCWYDNDSATNKNIYGALYNWFAMDAASNGGKNVCPTGWHVPADAEWTTLTTYIGGTGNGGGKLKETGTAHWNAPNVGATNETGFTALGAGWRSRIGRFLHMNMYGVWWSTSEFNTSNALYREIYFDNVAVYKYDWYKNSAFSVRCVKD